MSLNDEKYLTFQRHQLWDIKKSSWSGLRSRESNSNFSFSPISSSSPGPTSAPGPLRSLSPHKSHVTIVCCLQATLVHNLLFLFSFLWSIIHHDNEDSVFLCFAINVISIPLDIIILSSRFPTRYSNIFTTT